MNGRRHRNYNEFGPHGYPNSPGTHDCSYGCGCSCGGFNSEGPAGIDPLPGGRCPSNPLGDLDQSPAEDLEDCINGRIYDLTLRLESAIKTLQEVEPSKVELANTVRDLSRNQAVLSGALLQIRDIVSSTDASLGKPRKARSKKARKGKKAPKTSK